MYNFTLIIPTHNRHKYLKRSIEYFKNIDAKVIYCDSSEKVYDDYLAPNMEYLHLPSKKFAEKILITLNKTATDFVALCADDDFILIESLYVGVLFLEKNREYRTILGEYIAFYDKFNGSFYNVYQKLPQSLNYNSKTNAKLFFENYYQILWALYDKDILKKSFTIIKESGFSNDNFIELTIGAIVCDTGGVRFLNEIWGVRELTTMEHWGDRHLSIPNNIKDKNIKSDFKLFKTHIDEITYVGYADLVLSSYLKCYRNRKTGLYLKILLKKLIPKELLLHFKNYYSRRQPDLKIENMYSNLKKVELSSEGELKNIMTILKSYV